jgi:hypothetical protein
MIHPYRGVVPKMHLSAKSYIARAAEYRAVRAT